MKFERETIIIFKNHWYLQGQVIGYTAKSIYIANIPHDLSPDDICLVNICFLVLKIG